ncbi:MAG: adenosylcobalamin-dependent ribonucleoside-diphosphate reductase [Phycisphaerae bacterium]
MNRYLLKDPSGRVIETQAQMLWRVARAIARADVQYEATRSQVRALARQFLKLMKSGLFLPNSPTLMNAGRKNGMLSGCFVLPVLDSIEGIFDAIKHTAQVQKAGGGTGFSFDSLRPTGDLVASSGGTTSGPISFMRVFSAATSAIQQGAFRRGANMAMMSVEHPDILKHITAKNESGAFENFNISVKMPDSFMKSLMERPGQPHVVINPRNGEQYFIPRKVKLATYGIRDLIPADRRAKNCYTVADVWSMIVHNAHATGEPGVCFIDRVNADNPTPALGRIEATNPCGEQPLLAYESCTLGSIDLAKFVTPDGTDIDWDALRDTIVTSVRFLDDVLDVNHYPTETIKERSLGNRKIGLGLMGFADALIMLGIRYDSDQAEDLARRIAKFLSETAHQASQDLAKERGCFPNWKGSIWDTKYHRPMRNAACTTIAPTGSISIIAGCSSGIEPVFSLATKRRAMEGREFISVHPLLEELGRRDGWMTHRIRKALLAGIPPKSIPGFPKQLAEVMVTAHEVTPQWHVRIQAAFQKHIDNAVSKTVNLPASATVNDVDQIFRMAYEAGCKGITVYRDGSRSGQTLAVAGRPESHDGTSPRPRPRVTSGRTFKFRMGCGTLYVVANRDETGQPCEVFASLGKAGGCPSQSEATCRAVSAALRSGVDPKVLVEQLKGIRCMSTSMARKNNNGIDVLSCPDAIARAIEEAFGRGRKKAKPDESFVGRLCRHCKIPMRRESGCFVCDRCQFSSCG